MRSEIKSERVFCGRDCYLTDMRRRSTGKRVQRKMYACFCCGVNFEKLPSQMEGKKYHYCSMACKNKHNSAIFSGKNHPRWNEKLTAEERITNRKYPEYLKWRDDVYKRDSYTCQCCGDSKGGNLVAHHVYNYSEYPEIRTEVDNGITLCSDCHKSFHDSYGYTKNNELQLLEFISLSTPTPSQAS